MIVVETAQRRDESTGSVSKTGQINFGRRIPSTPIRTGRASPLRVATGGNASSSSETRRRRSPACANRTAWSCARGWRNKAADINQRSLSSIWAQSIRRCHLKCPVLLTSFWPKTNVFGNGLGRGVDVKNEARRDFRLITLKLPKFSGPNDTAPVGLGCAVRGGRTQAASDRVSPRARCRASNSRPMTCRL